MLPPRPALLPTNANEARPATAVRRDPREGWADDAQRVAKQGGDALVWPEIANEGDDELVW